MSIEAALEALTAAVKENTDVQKAIYAKINGAAAAAPASAPADKPAADKAPAADKPARATRGANKAPKVPTVKEIQEKTTGFLDVEDDTEYEERAAVVVQITEAFGVKKMSDIADEDRVKAMEMLDAAIAGDDPFAGEPQEETKPARRSLV